MGIPESQLDIWAKQGSVTQSRDTYQAIRNTLYSPHSLYANLGFDVFLQGSYGNDTNVYSESDVDVVIVLKDTFHNDLGYLQESQKSAFKSAYPDATYTHSRFKQDVVAALTGRYGSDVTLGKKAISIAANGGRRKADVIVAIQHRRYTGFRSMIDQNFIEGICFYDSLGEPVVNFPRQHSKNCTAKHQRTGMWYKPVVRIIKNIRNRLVGQSLLNGSAAPSYYLEGLMYNMPDGNFGGSYSDCLLRWMRWMESADHSKLTCANEQYYLLDGLPSVTWNSAQCDQFYLLVKHLWNHWPK